MGDFYRAANIQITMNDTVIFLQRLIGGIKIEQYSEEFLPVVIHLGIKMRIFFSWWRKMRGKTIHLLN